MVTYHVSVSHFVRYGGEVVLQQEGRLSVGGLITFQLYWNMINSR